MYAILYDQTKLLPDEMTSSKSAIQANVPGLTEAFYVYPDGVEDPSSETYAAAAGYTAARGSLAMKDQDNATASANSLYANGVNVQNITSLAAIQIHEMSPTQISQVAQSLVFRAAAWGVPYGMFTHYNSRVDGTPDISNAELGYLLDGVTENGGVWMTNAALTSAIMSGTGLSGSTRYVQSPTGNAVNLAAAGANSPTVGRGAGTAYPIDMNGTNRSGLGAWDIGATAYLSQRYGLWSGNGSKLYRVAYRRGTYCDIQRRIARRNGSGSEQLQLGPDGQLHYAQWVCASDKRGRADLCPMALLLCPRFMAVDTSA